METHPLTIYRKKNHITQDALAYTLGVSHVAISHWENGKRNTSRMARTSIARTTGIAEKTITNYERASKLLKQELQLAARVGASHLQEHLVGGLVRCDQPTDHAVLGAVGAAVPVEQQRVADAAAGDLRDSGATVDALDLVNVGLGVVVDIDAVLRDVVPVLGGVVSKRHIKPPSELAT